MLEEKIGMKRMQRQGERREGSNGGSGRGRQGRVCKGVQGWWVRAGKRGEEG